MAGARYLYRDVAPFTIMVALECSNVGLNTLFKAATLKGLSYHVFIVYSYALAALILLPSPFLYRKRVLPPLGWRIIGKLFLLGLIGSASLQLGYKGIEYGSPTLASAMSNLIPAFTFILAVIFRMEKLAWRSSSSQAKIIGTMVSIGGAIIIILYKGPSIIFTPTNSSMESESNKFLHSSNNKWIIGSLLLSAEYILTPVWYVLQAQIIKEYPAELVVVLFYNIFAAMISGAISLVAEPDKNSWILKPDISLAAILYSGLSGEFLAGSLHAWVLHHKGPVYVSMFKPLSIAIAAAMGVIFLGDTLYLGSMIGAAIVSLGFYAVMWGKAMEEIYQDFDSADLESSPQRTPLLQNLKAENSQQQ